MIFPYPCTIVMAAADFTQEKAIVVKLCCSYCIHSRPFRTKKVQKNKLSLNCVWFEYVWLILIWFFQISIVIIKIVKKSQKVNIQCYFFLQQFDLNLPPLCNCTKSYKQKQMKNQENPVSRYYVYYLDF